MLELICPICRQPSQVALTLRGFTYLCPLCATPFSVPSDTKASPQPILGPATRSFIQTTILPLTLELPPHLDEEMVDAILLDEETILVAPTNPFADPILDEVVPIETDRQGPSVGIEGRAFTFESEQAGYKRVRVESKVRSAANWLNMAVAFTLLTALLLYIFLPSQRRLLEMPNASFVVAGFFGFTLLALIFMGLAAYFLYHMTGYPMIVIGAVWSFLEGLLLMPPLVAGVYLFVWSFTTGASNMMLMTFLVIPVALFGTISSLFGGISTFMALANQEVAEAMKKKGRGPFSR